MVMSVPSESSTEARSRSTGESNSTATSVSLSVAARAICQPLAGATSRMLSMPPVEPTVTVPPSPIAITCEEGVCSTVTTDAEDAVVGELLDVAAPEVG